MKEGQDGSKEEGGDEGMGCWGRRKVNEYQTLLFLVLPEGLPIATRPYCFSHAPFTTQTLWRSSSVSQQAVANIGDGLRRNTRLL